VSWYQPRPELSLALIARTGAGPDSTIIDVGGGDAALVDALLDRQVGRVTVLDLSGAALTRARERLGPRANDVCWLEADVTQAVLPPRSFDVWHDRAVFHFLTRTDDQQRYVAAARDALRPGGYLIVTTFAADGPARCSGLAVARYSPDALRAAFGEGFDLVTSGSAVHRTPSGAEQRFTYCCLRRQ
jgi:ubiquinone/menaquinone biosynthesis C-methylase UbiE